MTAMEFVKYTALGNDYLVFDPAACPGGLTSEQIRQICDRHYGVGSDGLLLGPYPSSESDFGLRIFNPDGSEAEKSGNGLRIFSRYLYDRGLAGIEPFTISTPGGTVRAQVHPGGGMVTVEMGQASFDSRLIPVLGPAREVVDETMLVDGRELRFCAVTMGNPHCVVLQEEISASGAQKLGPQIEADPRFPRRTNVQFMQVLDRENIRIEIWERGAGYTLASGSSSCAAAAAAHRLGLCGPQIAAHMPGGRIDISIANDGSITMTGPVRRVFSGSLAEE